jgi:hypothetical protein
MITAMTPATMRKSRAMMHLSVATCFEISEIMRIELTNKIIK